MSSRRKTGPLPNNPDTEMPSLPGYVVWGIIIFLLVAGGLFFLTTDTYILMQAESYYSQGNYVAGLEIIYGVIGRTGPNEKLLQLRDEGLFSLSHKRMDDADFSEAIPLLDRIITGNENAIGSGGSRERILEALQDKAVCHLMSAQGRGNYVDPFDVDLTNAEEVIDTGLQMAEEIDSEEFLKIYSVLHVLKANIQTERAAYFWYVGNRSRASTYLFDAEAELDIALSEIPELAVEYKSLILEMDKLKREIGGDR